ncbi:MAG: Rieske (2Fe-2S) protein [Kofleriaceae bacterium]|nr:Rieske (2Fe-2S) protein [Kofleriaceae bacterium]MBP6840406.1 Rieske (2Fe-2S) protein [Kofleriaceae bacterium]MBP9206475.1 Rieske (2Fe-2S) protein [Kofleriaceae bacterium]
MPSLSALLADLLPPTLGRPSVAEVAAGLAPGQLGAAEQAGQPVVVVRQADGQLHVLDDACPHDGGPLSDGYLEAGLVVCARHGWEVDPASGACPRRPQAACRRRSGAVSAGRPAVSAAILDRVAPDR